MRATDHSNKATLFCNPAVGALLRESRGASLSDDDAAADAEETAGTAPAVLETAAAAPARALVATAAGAQELVAAAELAAMQVRRRIALRGCRDEVAGDAQCF